MPLSPIGLTKGLIERIRERVKREFDRVRAPDHEKGDEVRVDNALVGPATDAPAIMYRLRYAARSKMLLWMKYNNTWRHVEPYSFRYRSRGMQPLFYGYCQLHSTIEAYRIDRIQDVHVTDRPYNPRWSVEIG